MAKEKIKNDTENVKSEKVNNKTAKPEEKENDTYVRYTPFGVEEWDPETKRTVMKKHG